MIAKKILFFLLFSFTVIKAQSADDILGSWMAVDHSVAVKVYKVNDEYRAKVIWFDEKLGSGKPMNSRYDSGNPNPALRSRKIIGMEILEGLEYKPETHSWEHGIIYDASSGRHWDSSVKFGKDGLLNVRGYWKFKWIGKSLSFKKLRSTL
ncbi:DUF2147 domain-containing protein [Kaistella palustris]|uniref:DUF2147 domain-containing protein n=1 Tax=Kaistella palustris TaxID=493376 RepID=UPI00041102CF|nr:DUF2147 domain-containing protein [Kaistella palustris]